MLKSRLNGKTAAKPRRPQFTDAQTLLEGMFKDRGFDTLKKAIREGFDINIYLKHGRTALMHAAAWDRPDMCRFLLRHGARPDAKDKQGKTAYSLAKEFCNREVCKVLLEESKRTLAKLAGRKATDAVLKAIDSVK
jgi:ankyrin repeat protein